MDEEQLRAEVAERKVDNANHTTTQLKSRRIIFVTVPVLVLLFIGIGVSLISYIGIEFASITTVLGVFGVLVLAHVYLQDWTPD